MPKDLNRNPSILTREKNERSLKYSYLPPFVEYNSHPPCPQESSKFLVWEQISAFIYLNR